MPEPYSKLIKKFVASLMPHSMTLLTHVRLQKTNGLLAKNANPYHHLNEIGKRTKTFIRTADDDPQVSVLSRFVRRWLTCSGVQKLLVWATQPADVEAAKQELVLLVQQIHPTRRLVPGRNAASTQTTSMRAMAKISAHTKQELKAWVDRYDACQKVELYRREPDTIENFSFTVCIGPILLGSC